jgi:glycosidase
MRRESAANPVRAMRLRVLRASLALLVAGCAPAPIPGPGFHDEIVYHVVQRSFFDSDGDLHGDFAGLESRLPYIEDLGVTTVLVLPIVRSEFYHNYFPTDFESVDPEFGTMDDWVSFVRAAHERGMKVLLDMETQYVSSGHPWLDDAWRNPASPLAPFVAWKDSLHETPMGVFGIDTAEPTLRAWPDLRLAIAMLNLDAPEVRDWMAAYFAYWADPNGDGRLDDGVDGFRIDHIMDDLDYRGTFTNLYEDLWKPAIDRARSVNPDLFVVGEQADWTDYGERMIEATGASAAFGFPLRFAISGTTVPTLGQERSPEPSRALRSAPIIEATLGTIRRIPEGRYWLTFIENHDTERWASAVEGHDGMIRAAAVLNLTLPGIPAIYYGQELGMTGWQGTWGFDANDIPIREAFPWTPDPDDPGTAAWYRDSGPWWDGSIFMDGSSARLALSVQRSDPESVWTLYRNLTGLRRSRADLQRGGFVVLGTGNPAILAFARSLDDRETAVLLNLSDYEATLDLSFLGVSGHEVALGTHPDGRSLALEPWAFSILVR